MDDIQRIHLLPLVLVQTLDLNIVNGIVIQHDSLRFCKVIFQFGLSAALDIEQTLQHGSVIDKRAELLQFHRIFLKSRSYQGFNQICQLVVAVQQPAAEGDAVCLIVELLRINLVEVVELRIFQNLRVQVGNAVDTVAVMNIHMCHMHAFLIINDRNRLVIVFAHHAAVQFVDDRKKLRNCLFQEMNRPFFQCLRKDRVVCVRAGLRYDLDRLIHQNSALHQKTDQLRNHHARVCIVDLDCRVLIQLVQIAASCQRLVDDELCRIADHKILLVDAK